MEQHNLIGERAFQVAKEDFRVNVGILLGLGLDWDEPIKPSRTELKRLVSYVRRDGATAPEEFWNHVRNRAEEDLRRLQYQRRTRTIGLLLASLPPEQYLQRIQRYEAHLSREFYRALHELQRIQASRAQGCH